MRKAPFTLNSKHSPALLRSALVLGEQVVFCQVFFGRQVKNL